MITSYRKEHGAGTGDMTDIKNPESHETLVVESLGRLELFQYVGKFRLQFLVVQFVLRREVLNPL